MPLIIMTGLPSSGKSKRCREIKQYFELKHSQNVDVISEADALEDMNTDKNRICFDTRTEKHVRALLKNNVTRVLSKTKIVILDASNNVKGFRYEVFCAAKCYHTTQCTIECDISRERAWAFNEAREESERYTKEAFDALVERYEPPNYNTRWDTPLITVQVDDPLPEQKIHDALFGKDSPLPNMSTQKNPVYDSSYIFNVESITKKVVSVILKLKDAGESGDNVPLEVFDATIKMLDDKLTKQRLESLQKQFVAYLRLNPIAYDEQNAVSAFLEFLHTNVYGADAVEN